MTRILNADPAAIAEAAEVLRRGGLVAFPTETVYGLGANALDPAAVARIFAAKGRPPNNPVIVHIADFADVGTLARPSTSQLVSTLAERFWPGPLTLVLPKTAAIPDVVTAGGSTVAVRMPAHPVTQALLRAAGVPLAAPSANRSTELSPTRAEHVLQSLGERIDLILDGGPTTGGIESTVLDLTTDRPRLLRPGLVTPAEIETAIGPIAPPPYSSADAGSLPLPSPGMMEKHYAPRAPLELADGDGRQRVLELMRAGHKVGWLTWSRVPDVPGATRVDMPTDPSGYATRLYAALHELDEASVGRIVVVRPPRGDAWLAIADRLHRASG